MSIESVVTIGLMTVATIATRLGGLWLIGRVKMSPFVERWLKALPCALITAIVAPTVLGGGTSAALGAVAVILTMARTRSLLLSLAAGVGAVFVTKMLLT
jgi:uncharacterized membrane protein